MKLSMKNMRLLRKDEVPQVGDFSRWSESMRDGWIEIGPGNTRLLNLPVATIRDRAGQDQMQFCTYRHD